MSDITLAPRRRPLWRLFFVPVLLLIAAIGVERVLVLCGLARSTSAPTPGARTRPDPAGSMSAPSARSAAFRSASKSAATAPAYRWRRRPRGSAAHAVHGQARRDPGGGADLRSEITDRRVHGAGDDFRSGQPPSMTVNWSTARSSMVGLPACRSASRWCSTIPRSIASTDRCRRRSRAPRQSSCMAGIADGSPADHPVIETVLQISRRQHAGAASAARRAVRCRRARQAQRPEGFFAKTLAASGFAKSRPRAAMSRSCSRGSSRAI